MATPVIMPRQGQSVESCILTEWYKGPGDSVVQGELLFAYETDKASFEEEAQADGLLLARFFEEGEEVPVLVNVAVIGLKGEQVDAFHPHGSLSGVVPVHKPLPGPENHPAELSNEGIPDLVSSGSRKTSISPRAKNLAREKRVVVENIAGSGPGGRIIERDILEEIKKGKRLTPLAKKKMDGEDLALPGTGNSPYGRISSRDLVKASSEAYTEIPLSNVRKIVANAMYNSLQNSAQLTHHMGANASNMLQLRSEVKKRLTDGYAYNITLNDMVVYAVCRALKVYPEANAHFIDGMIRQFKKINMGLAVDTERGLLVPALLDADDLTLPLLSSQLKDIVDASRGGSVSPDLLAPEAASFTISNLGNYGVEMFTPVINLPQVAILGVNTIIQRPGYLADGSFGFQPFIGLSLTYDHRALDGGPATRFLAEIKKQVESLSMDLL